jgi:hypothetical protein
VLIEVDEALRVADERIATGEVDRVEAQRQGEAAAKAAGADREALTAEVELRRAAEIAAGEARSALATLREEYAAATAALRRDHERALTEALQQRAEDEARRVAARERLLADEVARYRAGERAAREELTAAHERALAAERAAADRRVDELRMALLARLAAAVAERDALRGELDAAGERLHQAVLRATAADELARERAEVLNVVQSQLQWALNPAVELDEAVSEDVPMGPQDGQSGLQDESRICASCAGETLVAKRIEISGETDECAACGKTRMTISIAELGEAVHLIFKHHARRERSSSELIPASQPVGDLDALALLVRAAAGYVPVGVLGNDEFATYGRRRRASRP